MGLMMIINKEDYVESITRLDDVYDADTGTLTIRYFVMLMGEVQSIPVVLNVVNSEVTNE